MGSSGFQRKRLNLERRSYSNLSQDYADLFVEHLLQALSAYQITIEHDYASLVIILGGRKHPLLAGFPQICATEDGDVQLTKADLLNTREDMISRT